jgi:Protein of unknown function (DUF3305)
MRESPGEATAARLAIGIVLDRRETSHPWQDHTWRVHGLLVGGGPLGGWRPLESGTGWARYYAGVLELRLHPDEVASYRYNLASRQPAVYVILRRTPGEHEVTPFHVTACPVEAQDYMAGGDEIVEAVAMPQAIAGWLHAFVDRHPVPDAFVKRTKKAKHHPDQRRQPALREREGGR